MEGIFVQIAILSEKITRVRSGILIVGFFQDVRPIMGYAGQIDWFTNGAISSLIRQDKINGTLGEATLMATSKILTPKILLMGLGRKSHYGGTIIQQLSTHVIEILVRLREREAAVELWGQEECSLDLLSCLDNFLQGCVGVVSQQSATGEAPVQLTLLTDQSDRINELALRIREYERVQNLRPGAGGLPQGSGTFRAETKR